MPDYYEKVELQEKAREQLRKRMDDDLNLLYLDKYIMRDKEGKAVPDIINTTLNKPRVFFDNVVSGLQATSEQVIVESDNPNFDTHEVEEFQKVAFAAANLRLSRQGKPSLNFHTDAQLCGRGRAARLVAFRYKSGVLIPEIKQWDARNVYYEYGEDGLDWGAYKGERFSADIQAEYAEAIATHHIIIPDKTAMFVDCWSKEGHEVWIAKDKIIDEPNVWGICNVVLGVVPLGYGDIFMMKDRAQYEGESIFAPVRGIIPELNRLITMLQSLNHKQVMAALQYKSDSSSNQPPAYPATRDVVSVGEGGIVPIDYGDARNAATMVYNMLEKAMEEGSLTSIDLGNLQFPLANVALARIGRGKDRVYLPRLNTRAGMNQLTAELFTQQVLKSKLPIELGMPGHKRKFDPEKLEGEYTTTYKYYLKDAESEQIRLAMADAASKYFDPETVLEKTLEVEDVKKVMQKRYYYMAEATNPNVRNYNIITSLLELAEEGNFKASRAAQIMAEDLKLSIKQIKAGKMMPPESGGAPAAQGGNGTGEVIPPASGSGSPGTALEQLFEKSAPKVGGQ